MEIRPSTVFPLACLFFLAILFSFASAIVVADSKATGHHIWANTILFIVSVVIILLIGWLNMRYG